MADLLAQFLPWVDEQKRAARGAITNALAGQGNPLQSIISALTPTPPRAPNDMLSPPGTTQAALDSGNQIMGGQPGMVGSQMDTPVAAPSRIAAAAGLAPGALGTLVRAFPEQVAAAQALASTGADVNAVWKATGAQNIPNAGWIREIPDTNMKIIQGTPMADGSFSSYRDTPKLSSYIDHPELFNDPAVGDLAANTTVQPMLNGWGAGYVPSKNLIKTDSITPAPIMHEVGHAVQTFQGLPNGSSPNAELDSIMVGNAGGDRQAAQNAWVDMSAAQKAPFQDQADLAYASNPGELLSRWTESRLGMTPDQLANTPPSMSPDPYLYQLFQQARQRAAANAVPPPGAVPSPTGP